MCIRDSFGTVPGRRVDDLGDLLDEVALNTDPVELTVGRACLLYTSDAADERSSVDLGGRRIIKKKRTTGDSGAVTRHRLDITDEQDTYYDHRKNN